MNYFSFYDPPSSPFVNTSVSMTQFLQVDVELKGILFAYFITYFLLIHFKKHRHILFRMPSAAKYVKSAAIVTSKIFHNFCFRGGTTMK